MLPLAGVGRRLFVLLAGPTSFRFVVTDHVRAEVTSFYPAQLSNFEFALMAGHVIEITLDTQADLTVFAELKALRLGDGECASIAAALNRGLPLAIDDNRARKKAVARDPSLRFLDTVGLMVEAIQASLITVAEADAIKVDWETNHRFIKKHSSSFAELIP
jgi:predicted nucleic acid-binding protein